jgi:hypothetical protein
MPDDPRIEKIVALVRELVADERRRVLDEMSVDELLAAVQAKVSGGPKPTTKVVTQHSELEKQRRAPAGSARVLCRRVLAEARNGGMTAFKIKEKASGEYEKMLTLSAIRNELSVGEKLHPQLYRQHGGVWYLPEYAPASMRVVS